MLSLFKKKKPNIIMLMIDGARFDAISKIPFYNELKNKTYEPKELTTFVLRDPKTRVISKSDFRDRVVHHAIINIIRPIFERGFIYDSCANQKGKGTLLSLKRFERFQRKVTKNFSICAFCLKADIKHYFQEVDHEILLSIVKRKIIDEDVIWPIKQILKNKPNFEMKRERESNIQRNALR